MPAADEEAVFGAPVRKTAAHILGQNIDDLSADELRERIAICRQEIARLEQAIVTREATRRAAGAFFKS